jgi:DNA primase
MANDFDEIKSRTGIDSFIAQVTSKQLKKSGSSLALDECPLCKHHDCFKVFTKTQSFKCFSCSEGGDLHSFVRAFFNIHDKFEALKKAAEITNYELTNSKPVEKSSQEMKLRQEIFNFASEFYCEQLLNDKKALQILSETRNYTIKTVKEFKIGYSGGSRNLLLKALRGKYEDGVLVKSGLFKTADKKLATENTEKKLGKKAHTPNPSREGNLNDFFGSKLFIFPHYLGKNVVDFTIKDSLKHIKKDKAHTPSPSQEGNKKANIIEYRLKSEHRLGKVYFYNEDAKYFDEFVIVEGEHDAIQLMRAINAPTPKTHPGSASHPSREGNIKKNVMAITGNPSEEALAYLEKICEDKIVHLCFDMDAAGQKYVERFFFRLWGKAARVSRISWEGDEKDIDEYLRSERVKVEGLKSAATNLIENSFDALKFLIDCIPDDEDISKILRVLEPFKERMVLINNSLQFEIALEYVREHFKKGKSVANFLAKQFEKARLDQVANSDYLSTLPYFEQNGCYYHRQNKGPVNISNFKVTIKDIILYADELTYRCDLKSVAGELAENVQFGPAERVDVRKFRTKAVSVGAFHFTGRDNELSGVWQYEESRSKARQVHYIQHYGNIQHENLWLFDNCAIKDGQIYKREKGSDFIAIGKKQYLPYEVRVYSGATPKLNLTDDYSTAFVQDIANKFHRMMDSKASGAIDSYAGYLFLGFLPAIIYSDEIYARHGFFPFLFNYGQPQTGKTVVMELLLASFGFISKGESWPSATEPGTYQFLEQLSSLPCWYDEFLNDKTFKNLLGTVKNIYNRTGAGKGGLVRRTIREVKGCLWLSGEDNPANEAVLSRSVIFRFSAINAFKTKAYKFLDKNKGMLSMITRNLLLEKTEDKAAELLQSIDSYRDFIADRADQIDPRAAINHAIPAASLQMLGIDVPEEFEDYLVKHAQNTMRFKDEEKPQYHFFNEMNYLYSRGILKNVVQYDETENEIHIQFQSVIKTVQKELRTRNESLRVKASSVEDYLKEMLAYTGQDRKYFTNDRRRCMVFEYGKLPENIKESIDDIVSYDDQK